MNKSKKDGILLFVKYPELSKVKSRLANSIDQTIVVKIYRLFVQDILQKLNAVPYEKIICFSPTNAIEKFRSWLGSDFLYIPQIGDSLGEKLKNSFVQGFQKDFSRLIVIGSDSPDLKTNIIDNAFESLEKYDSVIGPCFDGGYYLLGFKKENFFPKVFDKIPWSTSEVFNRSIHVLSKSKFKVHVLPTWYDVDTIDDLFSLFYRNQNTEFKNSKTMAYLYEFFKK